MPSVKRVRNAITAAENQRGTRRTGVGHHGVTESHASPTASVALSQVSVAKSVTSSTRSPVQSVMSSQWS